MKAVKNKERQAMQTMLHTSWLKSLAWAYFEEVRIERDI
jgi:hypothetical protein